MSYHAHTLNIQPVLLSVIGLLAIHKFNEAITNFKCCTIMHNFVFLNLHCFYVNVTDICLITYYNVIQ